MPLRRLCPLRLSGSNETNALQFTLIKSPSQVRQLPRAEVWTGPALASIVVVALALAVTPVAVAVDRNNTMDSTLTLALLLAAWAFIKATETTRLRFCCWARCWSVSLSTSCKKGSKTHMAVDTLDDLLALLVTPANEQDRDQVQQQAQQVQEVTGDTIEVAFVDGAYTGRKPPKLRQGKAFILSY